MPENYDISELKKKLEQVTGKKVYLYDNEELSHDVDLDKAKLEEFMRRAFKLTLQSLAVKNLFKSYLKKLINTSPYVKTLKQADDLLIKYSKQADDFYEKLTIEKDLLL